MKHTKQNAALRRGGMGWLVLSSPAMGKAAPFE
jgi:hypothetical protein